MPDKNPVGDGCGDFVKMKTATRAEAAQKFRTNFLSQLLFDCLRVEI
jgi:hypothetical protein